MQELDTIKTALMRTLGRNPTVSARRALATRLRALADEQDRIANAQAERRGQSASERTHRAGPGRQPATFLRVERTEDRATGQERLRLHIGRGLWYAIDSPKRITIQRLGGELRIAAGDEYAVIAGTGMPRVTCDGSRDLLADIADGRYDAVVRGRQIVANI